MPETSETLVKSAMEEIPSVTCEEYKSMKEEGSDHVFLDVREQDEWDAGHLENAVHIPRGLLEFKIETAIPDKDTLLILCCAKGGRAALAGQALKRMGYTNLRVLKGGYTEYCAMAE